MKQKPKPSEYETKIDQADSIITKAWALLKKHWGKLLVFLLIYAGYKFVVLVGEEMNKQDQEQVQEVQEQPQIVQQPYVVREYGEEQSDGSIAIIQVWNDSLETVKN